MAAFVLALAGVGTSTFLAVTTDRLSFDLPFTRLVQRLDLEQFGPFSKLIFWMGLRGVAGVLLIGLGVLLWVRGRRLETALLLVIALLDLWNVALRDIIARPRPTADLVGVVIGYGGIQGSSFPSGHATHAALFYGYLIYLAGRFVSAPVLRLPLQAVMALYIPVAGLWLVHAGRHWASDVLGGYAYGLIYLLVLLAAHQVLGARRARRRPAHVMAKANLTGQLVRLFQGAAR